MNTSTLIVITEYYTSQLEVLAVSEMLIYHFLFKSRLLLLTLEPLMLLGLVLGVLLEPGGEADLGGEVSLSLALILVLNKNKLKLYILCNDNPKIL